MNTLNNSLLSSIGRAVQCSHTCDLEDNDKSVPILLSPLFQKWPAVSYYSTCQTIKMKSILTYMAFPGFENPIF